jgi:hypothetical protein
MTKEQIDQLSAEAANRMVDYTIRAAGIILSSAEREIVMLQAKHLYLNGLEEGMRATMAHFNPVLKGGEIPNAKGK